ncbi:hypothetical protein COLO4_03218 [Corchorus olitorius]|uniref:Uncharacterized protein n=1 Tax=Corchorus olitorius TaxID=93759 RepID=A0A1R3KZ98_9ROSI|nr:hypothetical protein COLO4_03218 [Corchorus olitorius]
MPDVDSDDEVHLLKPLLSKVCIGYDVFRVEYEALHTVSFQCGVLGHRSEFCPIRQEVGTGTPTAANPAQPSPPVINGEALAMVTSAAASSLDGGSKNDSSFGPCAEVSEENVSKIVFDAPVSGHTGKTLLDESGVKAIVKKDKRKG